MQIEADDALVRRARKGDDSAYTLLVERYQDRLFRLAKAMLYRSEFAEDAAQEVFIRAYTGLGRFRFGSSVYTWLYATLRNVCREYNRRETTARQTIASELSDASADPARIVDASERLDSVMEKIRGLPDRQRDVVLLRVFEGLSVAETARILRCREGTVKTHLHRAMLALRNFAGEETTARTR